MLPFCRPLGDLLRTGCVRPAGNAQALCHAPLLVIAAHPLLLVYCNGAVRSVRRARRVEACRCSQPDTWLVSRPFHLTGLVVARMSKQQSPE